VATSGHGKHMRSRLAVLWLSLLVAVSGLVATARPPGRGATPPTPHGQTEVQPGPAFDQALTDTARVLAGLMPSDEARFRTVVTRNSWKTYASDFGTNWTRVELGRFREMRAWRDRELKTIADQCETVFYPFGGPDFLNVHLFFPNCRTYLLFGLEPPGSIPAIDRLPGTRVDILLPQLRESLSDVFVRDYFITQNMLAELKSSELNGTLPLLLAFLARRDARIVALHRDAPWDRADATGTETAPAPLGPAPSSKTAARRPASVTIEFVMPGDRAPRQVIYTKVDMQDTVFVRKTALIEELRRRSPMLTFLKSASYLMHDDRFSTVRSIVLDSKAILQDDTGVPYRFFDAAHWDVTLYGTYQTPVQSFKYGFQKDLDVAFRKPGAARSLPFTYGYHQRSGTSAVILATRKVNAGA
jgi:hypothetical protein